MIKLIAVLVAVAAVTGCAWDPSWGEPDHGVDVYPDAPWEQPQECTDCTQV